MGSTVSNNSLKEYELDNLNIRNPEMDKWKLGPSEKFLNEEQQKIEREQKEKEKEIEETYNEILTDLKHKYTELGEKCVKYRITIDTWPDQRRKASRKRKAIKQLVLKDSRIKGIEEHFSDDTIFTVCFFKQ